jgi:hypothetical protein
MSAVGFEPMIAAGERLQNYALDRAATGTGSDVSIACYKLRRITGRTGSDVVFVK